MTSRLKDSTAFPYTTLFRSDERISYLSGDEARALAEDPIMMGGESRSKGASLDRLISLTAGSPFYLQIFCDRLVQDRKSTRLNSSHPSNSYAVFCLKKKKPY